MAITTGFNPSTITNCLKNVDNVYSDTLKKALQIDVQSYVEDMVDMWACEAAVKFFNQNFKPAVEEIFNVTHERFVSIYASVNSAARAWANATENSYSEVSFSGTKYTVDVSCIKNMDANGNIGADEKNAIPTTESDLSKVMSDANAALDALRSAIGASGFVGGDQQASINNAISTIKSKVENELSTLISSTKSAIEETVNTYGVLQSKVSDAFSGK